MDIINRYYLRGFTGGQGKSRYLIARPVTAAEALTAAAECDAEAAAARRGSYPEAAASPAAMAAELRAYAAGKAE